MNTKIVAFEFGKRVAAAIVAHLPAVSKNVTTVANLTDTQIATGTTKAHVGLGSVDNYVLTTSYVSGTPTSTGFSTPLAIKQLFDYITAAIRVTVGDGKFCFATTSTVVPKCEIGYAFPDDIGPVVGNTELSASQSAKTQAYLFETLGKTLYVRQADGTYLVSGASVIKIGRWYYNRTSGRLFYADSATTMIPF